MNHETGPLVVRQHERRRCLLRASVWVSPDHAEDVVISGAITDASGAVVGEAIDCSSGGVGLRTPVLLPKGCCLALRLTDASPRPTSEGEPFSVTLSVRVQRVTMLDRKPTYYLGTSLISDVPGQIDAMQRLLEHVGDGGGEAPAVSAPPAASAGAPRHA